jgi:hypothetical protein
MRPVEFGEALAAGTRLTLFSDDKPDRLFTVIKFWMDETLGASLRIQNGVPSYEVEEEEGRIHLLLHLPIEEENKDRWCFGGRIRQNLIPGLFLTARWLGSKKLLSTCRGSDTMFKASR